jgi:hypothetical protein
MLVAVRFKTKHSPYNAGEVAGFEEDEARRLIKVGVAELYVVEPETPATTDADPAVRQRDPAPRRRR